MDERNIQNEQGVDQRGFEMNRENLYHEEAENWTNIWMYQTMMHLYQYLSVYNTKLMCFLCHNRIDHDQIKIFCPEWSEGEYIHLQQPSYENLEPTYDNLFEPYNEGSLIGEKFKYSLSDPKGYK